MSGGRLRAVAVAVALVLVAGCRLELDVNVEVAEDGSGMVEVVAGLDADAVDRIGGDLDAVLELDDLTTVGWVVLGPELESDGYFRVRLRRPFANADEAAVIFADLAAADGPFQDFAVRRETSFARSEWGFAGRIDFAGGLEAFGDAGLAAALDGQPLGQSVEEIEAELGESLSQVIQVRVGVSLPGDVASNATTPSPDGGVWQVGFGERTVDMTATGDERRASTLVALAVSATSAALLLLYAIIRLIRRSRAKRAVAT